MNKYIFVSFGLLLVLSTRAYAGQAEVRNVAIENNCMPKKTEVYKSSLGDNGEVIYRVICSLPKTVGEKPDMPPADSLMIACVQNLCDVARQAQSDKK